jgi:hypothetical protein
MTQIFGIIGFFISLLAILFASEVMRRSTEHNTQMKAELFKAQMRIKDLENNVRHVARAQSENHHQKVRQAETLTALANKGEQEALETLTPTPRKGSGSGSARFTPYSHKQQKTG